MKFCSTDSAAVTPQWRSATDRTDRPTRKAPRRPAALPPSSLTPRGTVTAPPRAPPNGGSRLRFLTQLPAAITRPAGGHRPVTPGSTSGPRPAPPPGQAPPPLGPALTKHFPSGENLPSSPESLNSSEKSMASPDRERHRFKPARSTRRAPARTSGRKRAERAGASCQDSQSEKGAPRGMLGVIVPGAAGRFSVRKRPAAGSPREKLLCK